MPNYAFIDENGVCNHEAEYSIALDNPPANAIEFDPAIGSRLYMTYTNGEWVAPPPPVVPEVVVVGISADDASAEATVIAADLRSVDAPVGATLTFAVELRARGAVMPLNRRFRMPLRSAEGSASRLIAVDFVGGVASFKVPLTESRHWRIDEAAINSDLPPGQQLTFAGLDVYALELS